MDPPTHFRIFLGILEFFYFLKTPNYWRFDGFDNTPDAVERPQARAQQRHVGEDLKEEKSRQKVRDQHLDVLLGERTTVEQEDRCEDGKQDENEDELRPVDGLTDQIALLTDS